MLNIKLEFTRSQVQYLIKILNNYRKIRKDKFTVVRGGYRYEDPFAYGCFLVVIDGIICYLESKLNEV